MRYLLARLKPRSLVLSIHLDESKVLPDGEPDPTWLLTREWDSPKRLPGETSANYQKRIGPWIDGTRADFEVEAARARDELADATAEGVILPQEGQPV